MLALLAGIGGVLRPAAGEVTFSGDETWPIPPPAPPLPNVENFEGSLGSYTGTTISTQFMVSASHVSGYGAAGGSYPFTTNGVPYNVVLAGEMDDLAVWEIAPGSTGPSASFTTYAPIYTGTAAAEVGLPLIDVGRGDIRGNAVQGGFAWQGYNGAYSWATNTVTAVQTASDVGAPTGFGGNFVEYTFTNSPSDPNEGIIANGDSGGGLFVDNGGTYQLDAVNSLVDGVLDSSGNSVSAALYDMYGYYTYNNNNQLVQINQHGGQTAYATQVSSKYNFIGAIDGGIAGSAIASSPINDPSGAISVYTNMTLGAITGEPTLTIGSSELTPKLQIATGSGASILSGLTISSGSTLDITNNSVIIDDPTWKWSCLSLLKSGYNGGLWNGTGIISSTAAANHGYGVGFADGSDITVPGLSAGEIEIAYTLYGDCNLDGKVDASDFSIFAANFGLFVSSGWEDGDFNYDGKVDASDFTLFASNFGLQADGQAADVTAADWAELDAFAAANGLPVDGRNPTVIPEPNPVFAAAIASACLLARRRRWPQRSPAIVADQSSP